MKQLKTVDIKGKAYVTVNERIKYFREHFTGYSMTSEITHINDNGVIIKTFINKTSFIENCETSSWGRCLANFGIGVDANVASADEVANAIKNQ